MIACAHVGQRINMSVRRRIIAILIALLFAGLGIALMLQRIGDVIGWDDASNAWWVIAIISLFVLLVAFLIYRTVSNRMSR